jgi:hypothetical protein
MLNRNNTIVRDLEIVKIERISPSISLDIFLFNTSYIFLFQIEEFTSGFGLRFFNLFATINTSLGKLNT